MRYLRDYPFDASPLAGLYVAANVRRLFAWLRPSPPLTTPGLMMMRPVMREITVSQRSTDDRLHFIQGGGWRILIGLLVMPLGILWMLIAVVFMTQGKVDLEILGLFLFGLILAGFALFNIVWRSGVTLDRQAGTVTVWSRMLVPLRNKVYWLDGFEHVTVNREFRSNSPATQAAYMAYPVALASLSGNTLPIQQPLKVDRARQIGRQLADYLGFPLVDRSQDPPVVYAADRLEETDDTP